MITTINTPRINTNDDLVQVADWYVESGAYIEKDQDIVDIETSKAVVTLTAEMEGYIGPLVEAGTVIHVGAPLYRIAASQEDLEIGSSEGSVSADVTSQPLPPVSEQSVTVQGPYPCTRFSKEAARLLQERGLTSEDFQGAGLVTSRSIDNRQANSSLGLPRRQQPIVDRISMPILSGPQTDRCKRVSLAKQAEIQSLSTGESGNINSMLSVYFDTAPIRARLYNEHSFDGNIQPLIIYEISRSLKQWPQFTAYFEDNSIHYYDRIDLGLAFDLGRGLKVVTIKEADKLSPIEIFEKTIEIGMRYTENLILPEELVNSTFTITDLSGFDILHFHPIINGNQSVIIGLGGDSAKAGYPMSINMTFDHRVSNGREVATFLKELRTRLLSYSIFEHSLDNEPEFLSNASGITADRSANSCDTCGIDSEKYYRDYSSNAYMLAYFREDGTLGSVCHRCYDGN